MADRPHVLTAARLSVYINGKLYGVCTGLSINPATPLREIRGIDSPFVQELAPTTFSVSGALSLVRISGDGGLQGQGLMPPPDAVSRQKYSQLVLVDRLFDITVFQVDGMMAEGEQWQMITKDIVHGSFNFRGISFGNEAT